MQGLLFLITHNHIYLMYPKHHSLSLIVIDHNIEINLPAI